MSLLHILIFKMTSDRIGTFSCEYICMFMCVRVCVGHNTHNNRHRFVTSCVKTASQESYWNAIVMVNISPEEDPC